MSNEFTRTYVDEDGNSLKESAYQLTKFAIFNRRDAIDAVGVDIRRLIGFVRIHESLFNPSLFFEIGIRDDYNFFEEFGLSGDEIILLEIETKALDLEPVTHRYEVHVTKINDYARGDSQVHAYTLIGVSKHAYYAPLTKANMVCQGTTTNSIKLLCNSLEVGVVEKPDPPTFGGTILDNPEPDDFTCISQTRTVFGMKNPLKAALELLSVSVDAKLTPYFLYQTLSNNVYLAPLSWINDLRENPVYRTFTYTDQQKSNPNTALEYFERSSQIVNLSSNIGSSPIEQLVQGHGPRALYEMNLATKKISPTFTTESVTWIANSINDVDMVLQPYVKYRFTMPDANDNESELPPLSVLKARHEDNLKAQIVAYDSMSHQFSVMGDMLLNPGRTIHLQFPKTLDPIKNDINPSDIYDEKLSKDYLVFQAVHTFQEGKHTTDITAKSNDTAETRRILASASAENND